jgi:DNA repair protein RecO (recombination protein O)
MPVLQSDAIILKTYPLGEADRIVCFFSREHGKLRGVANGARRMKNRFGASLEPLAHSRIQFFEKENRDLVRIQSADLLDSSMALFGDYDRAVCAGRVVDLLDRFLPEHEAQDAVFRLARATAQALEQGCPNEFAACYFEVWMLRLAGVFPDMFSCSACSANLGVEGARFLLAGLQAIVCANCRRVENAAVHSEVPGVLHWILKNKLEATVKYENFERGVRNLHELNDYWIRHYFER